MPEIPVSTYRDIVSLYTAAEQRLIGVEQKYYDSAYEVLIVQDFDPEIELLKTFHDTYVFSTTFYSNSVSVINAVYALQKHVLDKARTDDGNRYTNINAWMDDNSVTVPPEFAGLSDLAGFTITEDNIVPGVSVVSVKSLSSTTSVWTFSSAVTPFAISSAGFLCDGNVGEFSAPLGTPLVSVTIEEFPVGSCDVGKPWVFDPFSVTSANPGNTGWGPPQSGLIESF